MIIIDLSAVSPSHLPQLEWQAALAIQITSGNNSKNSLLSLNQISTVALFMCGLPIPEAAPPLL